MRRRKKRTPEVPVRHETIDEWLSQGNAITQCSPGVSAHVSEWATLAGRIDNAPAPYCENVDVTSWTVGSSVANSISEATRESNQENS